MVRSDVALPPAPGALGGAVGPVEAAYTVPGLAPYAGAGYGAFGMGEALGLNGAFSTLQPVIFANADAEGRPDSSRSPAIRAVFYQDEGDTAVKPGERSVLFGFTSNFPPLFEATRLQGALLPKGAATPAAANGGDVLPASNVSVDASEIPTPVAFEQGGGARRAPARRAVRWAASAVVSAAAPASLAWAAWAAASAAASARAAARGRAAASAAPRGPGSRPSSNSSSRSPPPAITT